MSILTGLAATSIVQSFVMALRIKAKVGLGALTGDELLTLGRQHGVQHAGNHDHLGGISGSIAPLHVVDPGLGFS